MRDRDVRELDRLIDAELVARGEVPVHENQFGTLAAENRWYAFEDQIMNLHRRAFLDREYCVECNHLYPCDTLVALVDYNEDNIGDYL